MQENNECMPKMREKGEQEENYQITGIEKCEWKFNKPLGGESQGLMRQMNVAWRRISGSPLLLAGIDRKVSTSKPQYERSFSIPNCDPAIQECFAFCHCATC